VEKVLKGDTFGVVMIRIEVSNSLRTLVVVVHRRLWRDWKRGARLEEMGVA
jgi:hypothetical protein